MFLITNVRRATQMSSKEICRQISKTASATICKTMNLHLDKSYSNVMHSHSQNWLTKTFNLQIFHRFQSTLHSGQMSQAIWEPEFIKNDKKVFLAIYPDIVNDLLENLKDSNETAEWLRNMLQYNLSQSRKKKGLVAVMAYKMLEKPENLTAANLRLAHIMGWCFEILGSYFYITDDIMDDGKMRRGIPCWHRQPDVGMIAVNDVLFIQLFVYILLKKHFYDKDYYDNLVELFNEVLLKTAIGQYLDIVTAKSNKSDLSIFTMDRYNAIVRNKTAYVAFYFPLKTVMLMCGIEDPVLQRQAETTLLELGRFYQIQDDFLDCFGNQDMTRKTCNDIQEGKCTWLSVRALEKANPTQKLIMEKYYGSQDPEHQAKIKDLYKELDIPQMYAVHHETNYHLIRTKIQQITNDSLRELLFTIQEKIYGEYPVLFDK